MIIILVLIEQLLYFKVRVLVLTSILLFQGPNDPVNGILRSKFVKMGQHFGILRSKLS